MTDPTQPQTDALAGAPATVPSTSDARANIGPMRHAYRVLSEDEKAFVERLKDHGEQFLALLVEIEADGSRELSLARTKIEEAVMWAVKHVTA